ncbi:HNH endonuclease [Blastococcus sp. MG754426]|uniref:HNH endonuclease signature motif containing protein n=1 Tax=unclassified Blastococcus TaxID=2619396 RepID=UPI001EF0438F|nr:MULTISPECIES: HNH endonuclease signature motif containing protein [unclassified Blastococcus]MCF6507988.1 HNH endonuclease [Blastococcus sp. MG754426]MCF6512642.1 HNH endonuclease [Blastococcus sp. MG754427]MCF6734036.1 HNH endonuclease [Blastococcus sp. KM273129]
MEDDGSCLPGDGVPMPLLPGEVVPPDGGEFELVCDIWSADAHMAREYARQAAAIAELARRRSVERDADYRPRGRPGPDSRAARPAALADVSDDFVSELAVIRHCSEAEAGRLAAESILLTTKLAATWAEMFAGRLSIRKVRILLDLLGDASDAVAAAVQARVLPGAADCPPSRLGDRVRYHLYRVDGEAKERRRREAERKADVHVQRTADDLGRLVVEGPLPAVHAARDAVDQYARWMRADGDDRPMGVLRSAATLDLILRPWDTSRPPVTAQLHVHAALPSLRPDAPPGAAPAELDGQLISAAQCRELLDSFDVLDLSPVPGGSVHVAIDDPTIGETVAVATPAELRRAAGRGRRVRRGKSSPRNHPPGNHPPGQPDGPGLRPPPPTPGYRPTAAQERLVGVRDRHCRMPGCRRRAGRCDIDHGQAFADGGPTDCWNLCCLCRRHHRIKTFARGWSFTLHPDGRLVVRTPSGVSRTTRPPGWYHDPEPEPPWLDEQAPPDPLWS